MLPETGDCDSVWIRLELEINGLGSWALSSGEMETESRSLGSFPAQSPAESRDNRHEEEERGHTGWATSWVQDLTACFPCHILIIPTTW